mmetsp:Transcript_8421/g.24904  ORF Transcript_8421/g.24904 Transcript_8421/m.24904 type:complete len:932 (-) Transcript_8421:1600-4395(-)|eukprot:CAMPEP_0172357192 /NCGR_PEP_ID=MMETSP1060-20121228/1568_1 /TAXON_ID=37318 /ORGANISM="Pseudo-nitzschia pungens, Strain cf. cingulata" /LENGTH=931 /DNA_ID=CAMNT_0013077735 /DNA_START=32 /DNA_END=2827 /DNA_ORIENTATION=-
MKFRRNSSNKEASASTPERPKTQSSSASYSVLDGKSIGIDNHNNNSSNNYSNSNSKDYTVVYRMGGDLTPLISQSPSIDRADYLPQTDADDADDVHRIVSAVKQGLRRSKKSKKKALGSPTSPPPPQQQQQQQRSPARISPIPPPPEPTKRLAAISEPIYQSSSRAESHVQSQLQLQLQSKSSAEAQQQQQQEQQHRATIARDRNDSQNSEAAIKGAAPAVVTPRSHNFRKQSPRNDSSGTNNGTQRSRQQSSRTETDSRAARKTKSSPARLPEDSEDDDLFSEASDAEAKTKTKTKTRQKQTQQQQQQQQQQHWSREEDAGIHGFFHRMMFDESVMSASVEDGYNYIDDVSYSGSESTSSEDQTASSSSTYESGRQRRRRSSRRDPRKHRLGDPPSRRTRKHRDRNPDRDSDRRKHRETPGREALAAAKKHHHPSNARSRGDFLVDPDHSPGTKPGELHRINSSTEEDEDDIFSDNSDDYDDDDDEFVARRDAAASLASKAGLEVVAQLLAGATTEIVLDAGSIASCPMTLQQARKVARPIAEALAKTKTLLTLILRGPWNNSAKNSTSRNRSTLHDSIFKARNTVLQQILKEGLKRNTSVTTLVIRSNKSLDRYAGSIFGDLFRTHSKLARLELQNCSWGNVQHSSGWNCLLLGLQHSKSIKSISLEGTGLSASDLDGISLTIKYLELVSVRLVGVNLHTIDDPESLVLFFRTVQETTSIRELELSRNLLGGGGHPLRLLCKSLSGDSVELYRDRNRNQLTSSEMMNAEDPDEDDEIQHHIEKLTLVDCGISRTSDVKMLTRALTTDDLRDNPIALSVLEVSGNQFGNAGAKVALDWVSAHPNIKTLGMLSCNVGAKYLKIIKDQLRYNNSFLQTIGLSSDFSLAILDSVSTMEHVFGGNRSGNAAVTSTSTAGLNHSSANAATTSSAA